MIMEHLSHGVLRFFLNFLRFFPDIELPEEKDVQIFRSSCLRTGTYLVLRRIIAEYGLEKLMQKREELRRKELMDAFVKSDRTYDEIMEFLKSGKKEL